MSSFTTIKLN